jgi:hypothetical protein
LVIEPLVLPLAEPLVPAPALGAGPLVVDCALEELRSASALLDALRSAPELALELGGLTLISVLLDEDDGRSVFAPADELPGVVVVVEDDELDRSAGGVTVVVDEDEVPGRAEEPVVALRLSPQALNAAATAATIASFAKFRKVLSIL